MFPFRDLIQSYFLTQQGGLLLILAHLVVAAASVFFVAVGVSFPPSLHSTKQWIDDNSGLLGSWVQRQRRSW